MALGDTPLTTNSSYKWVLTLTKDGAVWDLTGLAVVLHWRRPDGTAFSKPADSVTALGVATYTDAAPQLDAAGGWTLAAFVPGFGYTAPAPFRVVDAP